MTCVHTTAQCDTESSHEQSAHYHNCKGDHPVRVWDGPLIGVEYSPWAASLPELMGATLHRVCWKAASTCKLPSP